MSKTKKELKKDLSMKKVLLFLFVIGFLMVVLTSLIRIFDDALLLIKYLEQENERLNPNTNRNNDLPRLMNIITSQKNLHDFCLSKGYDDTAWIQTDFGTDKLEIVCYDESFLYLHEPSPTYNLEELFDWYRTK